MAGFCCGKIHHAAILSPAQPFLVGGLIDRADRLPDIVKERGAGNLAVYCAYSCLCFAATLTLILGLMCTDKFQTQKPPWEMEAEGAVP